MDRTAGRTLAKTTLEGLGLFAKVFLSEPETFGQYDPVAVVHSKSLALTQIARDEVDVPVEIFVTIYVRRAKDATESEKDTIEDTLDSLTRAAARALFDAFDAATTGLVVIGPSETGYPNRTFDSATYRMERFAVRFDDDEED